MKNILNIYFNVHFWLDPPERFITNEGLSVTFGMWTTSHALDKETGVRLVAHAFNAIMHTSNSLAVSMNSNFQLVAMVKTRDGSIWRRSLPRVDVAVILHIVVEILYLALFTLMIVQGFLMSTCCRGLS
jgi:hypothetical protein